MSLAAFLDDPARPQGTLRYHELQGFLFTIASAPELIRPSDWMPLIFGDGEPGYADLDEANAVLTEIMSLYNEVNASIFSERAALPADCVFRDDTLANLDDAAPVSQWSRGFVLGHTWLEDVWNSCLPDELAQETGATLMVLSFFASGRLAEAFRQQTAPGQSLEVLATTIRRVFPEAVTEYAELGRSVSELLADQEEAARTPRRRQKTGRNDPCPCGSGRKYKKCCGTSASSE
jgi:uncharacterized protein